MLTELSRFVLFGAKTYDVRKKPTLRGWAWGHTQNFIRRRFGLHEVNAPTLTDFAKHYIDRYLLQDKRGALPAGWPADVFDTMDSMIRARGGQVAIGDQRLPAFFLDRKSAKTLTLSWVAYVDSNGDEADLAKLRNMELALEDAIARKCNKKLNLRILTKPLRIEIDKPEPPIISLSDYWPDYISGKVQSFHYLLGIESTADGDKIVDNRLYSASEYSCVWFGASGSGKTQSMLAALLSLCATTSPAELSVIVVDPKGLDFPVDGLPHLAMDIITAPAQARAVVLQLAQELQQRAESRQRSASRKRILIVIDELKYLISRQEDDDLIDALADIGAMGRAWGISLFAGSQRGTNEFFPKRIHSQLPATWAGRVKDGTEANFVGASDADKLPGKGAAYLIEPDGTTRLQSAFLGDASKDAYAVTISALIKEVVAKWGDVQPHWKPLETSQDVDDLETDNDVMAALVAAYKEEQDDFTLYRLKKLYKEVTGKGVNHEKAQRLMKDVTKIA